MVILRKNSHDVTKERIKRMMDKYQRVTSIADILNASPEGGAVDKIKQEGATNRVNSPTKSIRKQENMRSDPKSIVRKSSRNSVYAHDQSTDDSRRSPRNFRNRNGPDRSSPIGSPNSRRNFFGQRNENIDLNSIPSTHSTHSLRLSEERTLSRQIPSNQLPPSNSLVKEDGSPMNVDYHLPPASNRMDNVRTKVGKTYPLDEYLFKVNNGQQYMHQNDDHGCCSSVFIFDLEQRLTLNINRTCPKGTKTQRIQRTLGQYTLF